MEALEDTCRLMQLSDCAMMGILSYLDATSLFNLSRTCTYFENIVRDQKLWRYIDARGEPNSDEKVQYCYRRINKKTTHLFFRAHSKHCGVVPHRNVLMWVSWENLRVLALENQRFDGKKLWISYFPRCLEELSLRKTVIKNGRAFFQGSSNTKQFLRVLVLDECNWVDSNFFMSIAKYPNLEILSIVKCNKLHFNVIPYLSVAKHGCKKLKIIDCRFSTVGNEFLRTFDSQEQVLAMYFQSMRSYELDQGKPLLKNRIHHLSSEDRDLLLQGIINNNSLDSYKYIFGGLVEELPQSELYEDPYSDCTCKYRNRINEDNNSIKNEDDSPKHLSMELDDFIDYHSSPQRFICRRHVDELKKLPKDFKNFFVQNQKKFYPESDDSDSDSDSDCCMFGMGKSQQMIVLKVRDVDNDGNIPEPEVIDISGNNAGPSGSNVISIDPFAEREYRRYGGSDRGINDFFQPSTSNTVNKNSSLEQSVENTAKRKAEESSSEENQKKPKMDESSSSSSDFSVPGTSNSHLESNIEKETEEDTKSSAENSENGDNNSISSSKIANKNSSSNSSSPDRNILSLPGSSREGASNSEGTNEPVRMEHPHGIYYVPPEDPDEHQPWRPMELPNEAQYPIELIVADVLRNMRGPKASSKKVKLRRISLRGYRKITDTALDYMRNLNLDLLDVTYTNVTKDGVEKFLVFNPNCRVLHKNFCVCKPRIPC